MASMDTKHPKDHLEMHKDEHSTISNTDLLCAFPPEFTNTQDATKKISILKHLLEKDLKAVDLKWSLFVAACNTYRYDTCLRPFPPMYIKNECKDIEALRKVVEITPPLAVLSQHLHDSDVYQNYGAIIELLYWVLVRLRDPYIKSLNKNDYDSVLKKVPSEMQVTTPNLIFQIVNTKQSMSAERWKMASQGYSTFYAYHGSPLENFHSIINYGLQQNMCKKSVYGEGIYLSSELGVSLPYSSTGYGWGGSCLGAEIACVALCELFHHPDVKKGDSDNNAPSVTLNPMKANVPNKYYLVTNSELVRVRYLLIYCQEVPMRRINNSGVLSWLKQHKLVTLVFTYVVLLASVGLTHNKQMVKYYKFFAQKAGLE